MGKKVVIVGGVAGGASAAARLRRLDEEAEIVLLERGEHVSYANCGLPYYIGGTIGNRKSLFVMTPEKMQAWLDIDVRVNSEALAVHRASKEVEVLNRQTGERYREKYDYLVLSPGAEPIRPPLQEIDHPRIFTLRSVADTDRIAAALEGGGLQSAVVVGGGFIGLEMAENLHVRGLAVTIVELGPQVLPNLDTEMAAFVQQYLRSRGVALFLGDGVAGFESLPGNRVAVKLQGGRRLETDLVLLSIGVKPEVKLAREAGLEVDRGIVVNEYLETSDPSIYAVGDAVQVKDFLTGTPVVVPLAGPANKQGRLAAGNIAGRREPYRGTQGTAALKVFDLTIASTGAGSRALERAGLEHRSCIIHPLSHAGYYPGGNPMALKLLFAPDGRILGAQAVGYGGVDKRIDVIAASLRAGKTIYDLQELELAYAPPFSSAKDPVNMAGFVAGNILSGDMAVIGAAELLASEKSGLQILDVREPEELAAGALEGTVNIPLGQLRARLGELDPGRDTVVYCQVGLRAYLACRILMQKGFRSVRNLDGGYRVYRALAAEKEMKGEENMASTEGAREEAVGAAGPATAQAGGPVRLDCCGLQCPGPIAAVYKKIQEMEEGQVLEVCATDPGFYTDVAAWCNRTGNTLLERRPDGRGFTALIRKGQARAAGRDASAGASPSAGAPAGEAGKDKTIVIFSGDLDKAIASFIIATGAAAMGRRVTMFFTFWGLNILRRPEKVKVAKGFLDRMFGGMMPRGSRRLGLSRMNMLGMGPKMIRMVMSQKNVDSLEALITQAQELGVRLVACQMSMDVMGIKAEELIDGVDLAGVASYLDAADDANVNLFI